MLLNTHIARLLCLQAIIFSLNCKPEAVNNPTPKRTDFFVGADLSYVNEMEHCGVTYREDGTKKDPFQLFSEKGCNLVRLRIWHTPAWYDTLNDGTRFCDLADVRKSIRRAKDANMQVLLNFQLSDTWADPGHQIAPKAWWNITNNTSMLADSLYQYIHQTLLSLHNENLLPDWVQLGNETNREILNTPSADASGNPINWSRNSTLFNTAIRAVRNVEQISGKKIKIALHLANPKDTPYFINQLYNYQVTDFDMIGISYYWAWHKPVDIAETGKIIHTLKQGYPNKEIVILETGYIWTNTNNDEANNIINETHPEYSPASPANQNKWLLDLSKTVKNNGGIGVIYWEPAWVSSPCFTPWGRGSHQEHAAFFDFNHNLLKSGGANWFSAEF
jgi:arabinogalactan endo-1,4-beta-galactosidase